MDTDDNFMTDKWGICSSEITCAEEETGTDYDSSLAGSDRPYINLYVLQNRTLIKTRPSRPMAAKRDY